MPITLTLPQFIEKASTIHNNYYSYTNAVYINSHTKLLITCPVHGDFNMSPNNHLNGQGCRLCNISTASSKRMKDLSTFINEAKAVHGDAYDYTETVYTGALKPITYKCNTCNQYVTQTAVAHLVGRGCTYCAFDKSLTTKKKLYASKFQTFININSEYQAITSYVAAKKPITIKHLYCGKEFTTTPDNFMHNHGCPSCADYGFDPLSPAILYYLEINNGELYKIGITNNTVESRFKKKDYKQFTSIQTISLPTGQEAYALEQAILTEFAHLRTTTTTISSGCTEVFTTNILQGTLHEYVTTYKGRTKPT